MKVTEINLRTMKYTLSKLDRALDMLYEALQEAEDERDGMAIRNRECDIRHTEGQIKGTVDTLMEIGYTVWRTDDGEWVIE